MLSLVLALLAPQESETFTARLKRPDNYFEGALLSQQVCAGGPSEVVHFIVGGQALQAPRSSVKGFLPQRMRTVEARADFETATYVMPVNIACAEAPVEAMMLMLDNNNPAIPRGAMFTASRFVSDEDVISWRDSGECGDDPDYVICHMETGREQRFPTMVMISRRETSRDGGPLFAVCEVKDYFVPDRRSSYIPYESMRCDVRGSRGGMLYEAGFDGRPLVDNMRAADNSVTDMLDWTE